MDWRRHDGTGVPYVSSTDGGGTWILVGVRAVGNDEYADAPVPSEQRVCYRVVAYNGAGEGPSSAPACTVAPAGPTNLVGVQVSGGIDLEWGDNSAAEDGYEVWLRVHGSTTSPCYSGPFEGVSSYDAYSVVAALAPGTTTYLAAAHDPDGCDPSTEFWYYVLARKDGGSSDWSNEVSAGAVPVP
jgi:hypothetical protein